MIFLVILKNYFLFSSLPIQKFTRQTPFTCGLEKKAWHWQILPSSPKAWGHLLWNKWVGPFAPTPANQWNNKLTSSMDICAPSVCNADSRPTEPCPVEQLSYKSRPNTNQELVELKICGKYKSTTPPNCTYKSMIYNSQISCTQQTKLPFGWPASIVQHGATPIKHCLAPLRYSRDEFQFGSNRISIHCRHNFGPKVSKGVCGLFPLSQLRLCPCPHILLWVEIRGILWPSWQDGDVHEPESCLSSWCMEKLLPIQKNLVRFQRREGLL